MLPVVDLEWDNVYRLILIGATRKSREERGEETGCVRCVYLNVSREEGIHPVHREREMGRGKISISSFLVVISRRDDDKRSSATLSI